VGDVRVVILRMPALHMLDATGAHASGASSSDLQRRGITVLLKGPRAEHYRCCARSGCSTAATSVTCSPTSTPPWRMRACTSRARSPASRSGRAFQ